MLQLKESIEKDELIKWMGAKERPFLDKIDRLGTSLSEGKWHKLYALCAETRKLTGHNVYVYASPNLYDYDTSNHRVYPRTMDDRTPLWMQVQADPKK